MGIVAAFDRALFFNPASKYSVLQYKTADMMIPQEARNTYHYRDHLIRFTAVGYNLPQTSAVNFELTGTWEKGKHGCQLQVERWGEVIPPTLEGIRGYLASGLLKGIGEKTADAIVQRFGLDSLNIIENHPERLIEIRGITEEKLEDIKSGYAESKVMRDLMTLLAPFKVTPATAMKIYQHFGPGGVSLIRQSPYRLCQIPTFGFKRVDAIVQKSGSDLQDPMRVQGAIFYTLERSRNECGHLYVAADELIKNSLLLLNEKILTPEKRLGRQQVQTELEKMILTDIVVSNKGNIPMIGNTASKTLSMQFHASLEAFEEALLQGFDFTQLPDFGETLQQNIYAWFQSEANWCLWADLRSFVTIAPPVEQAPPAPDNPFMGKTLVVTGKVEPYTRDGINAKIESLGARAGSSVSGKTDYLICGENAGSKLDKARSLGVSVLSPAEFFRMIGE